MTRYFLDKVIGKQNNHADMTYYEAICNKVSSFEKKN